MNTIIEPISGNAYHVRLLPETESERRVLHDGQDSKAIRNFYKNALDKKFGKEYKVGQLSVEGYFPNCISVTMTVIDK